MRFAKYGVAAAISAGVVLAQTSSKPFVSSKALENTITAEALLSQAEELEGLAYATTERNRLMGSPGHNATVTWLYNQLTALDGYYNVTLQPWSDLVQSNGSANFSANGVNQSASLMDFSSSGSPTAPLVRVSNLGCNASDYPAEVSGKIALISRGTCQFGEKSVNAGLAGAVGAVIYNNVPGPLSGTLGSPRPEGPYVPTVGISLENGTALLDAIANGTTVVGSLSVLTVIEIVDTFNVIAETVDGDKDNVLALGAHSDSVAAGPGINDDGSGTIGILEVAKQLVNYKVKNSVRFGWWSGEEEGLLGSSYYVSQLSSAELAKIRLYLNFDMIASPNYVHALYDGDGDTFNTTGPQGSAEIEAMFQEFFEDKGLNFTTTEFDGRSDYGPFLEAGIACGGTFTGAEGNKTTEDAAKFGGDVGVAYDINYHGPGDNVTNLNMEAFLVETKAIAYSVALYANSFESLQQTNRTATRKREIRGSTHARKIRKTERKPNLGGNKTLRRRATPLTKRYTGEEAKKVYKALKTKRVFV